MNIANITGRQFLLLVAGALSFPVASIVRDQWGGWIGLAAIVVGAAITVAAIRDFYLANRRSC